MLLCPKTASTLRVVQLPISPIKSMLFSASPRSPVIAPPVVSLPRSPARQPRLFRAFSTAAPSAETPTPAATSAMSDAVEHVVLFKAKDGIDPAKVVAMLSNLRSLSALDGVLHLTAAPVLCLRSAAASALGFTHLLHSRYRTKEDLAAYSGHPTHVAVVREHVLPICDDIMAVDWVGELSSGPVAPPPGSAARVTLAKLTETAGEAGKVEVLTALGEFGESVPGAMEQLTYGENFSLARAKGYSVGSIAVFSSEEQLEGLGAKWGDQMEAQKEKVRPLLESVIVVDFVVPPPVAASGL